MSKIKPSDKLFNCLPTLIKDFAVSGSMNAYLQRKNAGLTQDQRLEKSEKAWNKLSDLLAFDKDTTMRSFMKTMFSDATAAKINPTEIMTPSGIKPSSLILTLHRYIFAIVDPKINTKSKARVSALNNG